MPNKKPNLAPGEYGIKVQVNYVNEKDPRLSGTYAVELGAEFKDTRSFTRSFDKRDRRRYVRVDGQEFDMYAMQHPAKPGDPDTGRIERDPGVLLQRAAEWYAYKFVLKKLEAEEEAERNRQYAASLVSPDNWTVKEGDARIEILPIGIQCLLWDSKHNDRKREIMHRLVALAKEHGV